MRFSHAVVSADLGVPVEDDSVFDKKLMFLTKDGVFHFLTPLAKQVVLKVFRSSQKEIYYPKFDLVAQQVLSDLKYTNDTKGRVLESYVISMLNRHKSWVVTASKKAPAPADPPLELEMKINFTKTHLVTGKGAPQDVSETNWNQSILFEPAESNYPAVDLLIWDSTSKILYAIQVTITDIGKHMGDNFEENWTALEEKWKEILPEGGKIELVWLSDNDKCSAVRKKKYWIVLTSTLYPDFPLLKCLKKANAV